MNHIRELASWYLAAGCGVALAETIMLIGSCPFESFDRRDVKSLLFMLPANAVLCATTWPSFPYYVCCPGQYTLRKNRDEDSFFSRIDDAYLNSKALYMPGLITMMTYTGIYSRYYAYNPYKDGIGSSIQSYQDKFRDINYVA